MNPKKLNNNLRKFAEISPTHSPHLCLLHSIEGALEAAHKVVQKVEFWEKFAHIPFNERQRKVLNRLLEGFEGKLTTSKWAKLAKCSQDTAYRDILDLIDQGILQKEPGGGGRNTSYSLVLWEKCS